MRYPASLQNLMPVTDGKLCAASLSAFLVLVVMGLVLGSGCSRERPETSSTKTESRAASADQLTHPAGGRTTEGNPALWGFPPEQGEPWPIRMSSEPLSPTREANTGEPNVRWPNYRVPREIIFTAPPVPSQIVGPAKNGADAEATQ